MEFFLDTANLQEIEDANKLGLVDGVTTNPTLLAREGNDPVKQMKQVCASVDGPVSLEVISEDAEGMIAEAEELNGYGKNVVIKIPMTRDGLVAVKELHSRGIRTNVTLVFSPMQALLAAKAGATYVSPFVGRLDNLCADGMELITQIRTIFDNYNFPTKIQVASIRHPMHVLDSALVGANVATVPFKVITGLMDHPLTDKGLAAFKADWDGLVKK